MKKRDRYRALELLDQVEGHVALLRNKLEAPVTAGRLEDIEVHLSSLLQADINELRAKVRAALQAARERNLEPTEEERRALELYAETHGRNWKRQLLDDWTEARAVGVLQQIRNARGPSWLLQHYTPRKGARS